MLLSILVSYFLPVFYLKRVVARKVDQGDSSSLGNPSASTSDHLAVEDPKHLSGLADIKVRSTNYEEFHASSKTCSTSCSD